MNSARDMIGALDLQLRSIASGFAQQFRKEFGVVTSSNELQTFMERYEDEIVQRVTELTQQVLLIATSEGVDNAALLIEEVRSARAKAVSYLWRQIAGLRRPPELTS